MSYRLPPLQWLRSFEAAARHLSFTGAGRELGLTQTAVSQQIRSLEAKLGFQLFERLPRGLRLTDMGGAYLPSIRRAFDELSVSTLGLFGHSDPEALTVRAPVSFAVLWLAPRLPRFRASYPRISLRLFSSIWADALADELTDIDIRFGSGLWPGFEATLISQDGARVVCHRDVGRQKAVPARISEILEGNLIHVMGVEDLWARFQQATGATVSGRKAGTWVDTSLAALELVAAGAGSALILRSYVARFAESRPLWSPLDLELALDQAHYLLVPSGRTQVKPEALLFRDWLLEEARTT
ncbi:MAG: LysR family transcriptional regulator [Kiloniellales bacterium]